MTENITLWAWGKLSQSFSSDNPIQISTNLPLCGIYTGKSHSFIWTTNDIYTWGTEIFSNYETLPLSLLHQTEKPIQKSLICNTNLYILSKEGKLIKNDLNSEELPQEIFFSYQIKAFSCGSEHCLALDVQGHIYSWGNGSKGRLGQGEIGGIGNSPRLVHSIIGTKIIDIYCGYSHNLALNEFGKVFSWGSGADGRLGLGNFTDQWEPREVIGLSNKFISKICCGYLHSAVVSNTGEVLTFGFNGYGQLGLGNLETCSTPQLCYALLGQRVLDIACGAFHTVCICENGEIFSAGLGRRGQLGNGSFENSSTPVNTNLRIIDLPHEMAQIYCGTNITFLLTSGKCEVGPQASPTMSTYDASEFMEKFYENMESAYRPTNLPPKDAQEADSHKKLVAEQAKLYLYRIKEKERIQRRQKEKQLEREAEIRQLMKIWEEEIVPFWDKKKRTKQVERLIKRGIPPKVRGEIWMRLLGNPLSISQDYYIINVAKARKLREALEIGEGEAMGRESSLKLINLDIARTFNQLGYFREGSPFNQQLRDLLEAYTLCRPDIGYVQGMSYVAGMLLLNLEPYRAFIMFNNIVGSHVLIPFYRVDQVGISKRSQLFRVLFKHNLPELCDHFEMEGVQPQMFLIEWFLTLYTRVLSQDVASRIWDLYCELGPIILFQTGVAILKILNETLLEEDIGGIMALLSHLQDKIADPEQLILEIDEIRMPEWIEDEINLLSEENL